MEAIYDHLVSSTLFSILCPGTQTVNLLLKSIVVSLF